ncbi:ERI1 exoribonuclease 2 [Brachypodium distachyon]|nr:ERI1 exoribonuclease 2 [Brachypodium distachyon]|eukprot:XP_003563164.1 ERI1 exoribonuclease 2 [Brachypodium distachyon]
MSSPGVPIPAKFGGGVTFPSAMQVQEFDCFVVVDFEAICEKDARIYPQEIIEFPSVLVDGATGRLASAFRRYVRPRHHPVLTDFCRELTGIRQEDVDGGVDLAEALRLHDAWLEETMLATKKGGRFAVVTWGDWDCRSMLDKECRFKGLTKPAYFDRWINLRVPFQAAFGGSGRVTLQEAVRAAGLEWEGRLHCGLDDAINTEYLLVEVMQQGVQLAITGSLALPPPSKQQVVLPPPPQPQLQEILRPQPRLHNGGAVAVGCCYCGLLARRGVVVASGPMQGKYFYGCGNLTPAMRPMCHYFMWADCQYN